MGSVLSRSPHLLRMLPEFYQNCFQRQLKNTEYLTLTILVFLLQTHKQVSIELLATLMPYPIMFESRRRGIQRFLKLPLLKIENLWFPLIKYILRTQFKKKQELKVAVDRTQWRDKNIFVISLIWEQRAILQGRKFKLKGIQKYIGRVTECRRVPRRHSSFWIGLYGQCWVVGMEFCQGIVSELMRIRPNKLPFFQRGLRAMSLILSSY